MKALFVLIGLCMAAGVGYSFVRPLWKEGFRVMAVVAGIGVLGLAGGLIYLLR